MKFKDLKDVYFLAITNFSPFPHKTSWFSRIGLKDLDTNEHDISGIQLFFMQLPLFKKTKKDFVTMAIREKWAYFFKHANETSEEDLKKIIENDAIIKRAYEELDRFSWSEMELHDYESVEMKKDADEAVLDAAIEAALDKGEKRGEIKRAKSIVFKMLKLSLPVEEIVEVTGLSREEVDSLKK